MTSKIRDPLTRMCVLAFAWNTRPRWPLVMIGNRDEAHARPSAPLQRWADAPRVLAGRDLEAGGTWMGAGEPDRIAVVTNVRDPRAPLDRASRGLLVAEFLRGADTAAQHAARLHAEAARYRPFNLLLFAGGDAWFASNHPGVRVHRVAPGVHGLSNGDLDAPWPKVRRATQALERWLDADADDVAPLFDALADEAIAPDAELPDTGVGLDLERKLSPPFVRSELYGTRATTLVTIDDVGRGRIVERRFGPNGVPQGETALDFDPADDG